MSLPGSQSRAHRCHLLPGGTLSRPRAFTADTAGRNVWAEAEGLADRDPRSTPWRRVAPTAVRVSLVAAAVLTLAFAPAAYARDPALHIQVTLKGSVPSNAAWAVGGGSSSAWICLPASATSTWPAGSVIVPPCLSGRSYGETFQVPPGTRIDYHFDLALCLDAACQSTTRIRVIWAGVITMGRLDRTVTVTHTFRGLPDTTTAEAPPEPPLPAFGIAPMLVAALLGLGIGARRFATLLPRAR